MSFEKYREKIEQLLILKAANNPQMEAELKFFEIGIIQRKTNEDTQELKKWLLASKMVDKVIVVSVGYVKCIVNEDFLKNKLLG